MKPIAVLFFLSIAAYGQSPKPAAPANDVTDVNKYPYQQAQQRLNAIPSLAAPATPIAANSKAAPALAGNRAGTTSTPHPQSTVPSGWHEERAELSATARGALGVGDQWMTAYAIPAAGKDGRVVYAFGSALPVVVCAPLKVCMIELQSGEKLEAQPQLGDSTRWEVTTVAAGSGSSETPLIVIKSLAAGLDTDLILATDRRAYVVRLMSDPVHYLSRVAFQYPEDQNNQWQQFQAKQEAERQQAEMDKQAARAAADAKDHKDGITPLADGAFDKLYFDYKITGGDSLIRPLRVIDDGEHTYIEMPTSFHETPALLLRIANKDEMTNYRVVNNRYIVDRLFDKAVLLVGVGKNQRKVEITRQTLLARK